MKVQTMKPNLLWNVLLVGCLLIGPAFAQVAGETAPAKPVDPEVQKKVEEARKKARREQIQMQKRMMTKVMPRLLKPMVRIFSEKGDLLSTIRNAGEKDGFREYVGLSEEQVKQMEADRKAFESGIQGTVMPLMMKIQKAETDEEFDALARDLEKGFTEALQSYEKKQGELLSDAQKKKAAELCLQGNQGNFNRGGPLPFNSYEALDLTEEQRTKLAEIKREYSVEMEALFRKLMDIQAKIVSSMDENSDEDFGKQMQKQQKKVQEEAKSLEQEMSQLTAQTKARILALLDDGQQKKLDMILASAPEFIKKRFPAAKREADDEEWKKSWKPGDPVPEHAKPKDRGGLRTFPGF